MAEERFSREKVSCVLANKATICFDEKNVLWPKSPQKKNGSSNDKPIVLANIAKIEKPRR